MVNPIPTTVAVVVVLVGAALLLGPTACREGQPEVPEKSPSAKGEGPAPAQKTPPSQSAPGGKEDAAGPTPGQEKTPETGQPSEAVTSEDVTHRPEPVLVPPEELARLEQEAMDAAEANRKRACPRPVLRGDGIQERADEKLVAVIESDAFKLCFDHVKEASEVIDEYLDNPGESKPSPELARVDQLCRPLVDAVGDAIEYEDACSPYLAGRRGLPALVSLIRGGRAMGVLVVQALDRGHTEDALNFGLDWIRLTQDVARGEGAPLIVGMVAVAAVKPVFKALRFVLTRPAGMAPEMLARVEKELGMLLATEPEFAHFLAYERFGLPLHMILPQLKGPEYVPPGGFDHDRMEFPGEIAGKELEGISPRQQVALAWVAMSESLGRMLAACPAGKTPEVCFRALEKVGEQMMEEARKGQLLRSVKVLLSPEPDQLIRDWMLDILKSISVPAFTKYVARLASRSFHLAALRLHVVLRRQGKKENLTREELAQPRWRRFLVDPASGRPLRLSFPGPGVMEVRPAADSFGGDNQEYGQLSYEVSLP